MVSGSIEENLRLVLQPAKRARVNNARAIALKFRAISMARLGILAPVRVSGFLCERREHSALCCLHLRTRLPTFIHCWQCRLLSLPRRRIVRHHNEFARSGALATCRSYNPKIHSNMAKKTRQKKQITPERLMELSFAYAPPLIISAAAGNKVFDALENSAKTAEEVAKKTGASPRALRILMNALVGLDLLKKDRQGRYSLTPESAAFLISNKPGTHAGFFGTIAPHLISRWLRLTDIVREGRPAVAVNQETEGTEFFSQLVENIIPMSYPAAQKLGDHLKVAKAKNEIRVLDLGAGSGIWGIALAQKSTRVRVTAVDWAGMIPTTKRITQKFGVGDRFNYVEGDMLEANFGSGYDIATLGHILHS